MQDRIAALMACGFLSFFVLGAAGAASDTYFEAVVLKGMHAVSCNQDMMASEYSTLGTPDCSVHRVSTTYHRQQMANNLYRDQMVED
ncbi:MAG: hypothetical protein ACX94B_07600 [Henriciella sp.]|nr:hypothetical protein [Hyphomonadaceae bacterium]